MALQQQKVRRIVWTGAIAAVTATGVWYGAGLKITKEKKQEIQKLREATPVEKIAQLEEARGVLLAKRGGLERKIREVELRRQGKSREESMAGMERRRPGS
ncbi:hypothetical protein BJ878DRAFT_543985 [Calycina marina]|uniref:Uncharacterized protein n=1 Tax=Calycina marina TaxID=1763456 RepID=A0A9P7Z0P6_9HELO|nr:hypothetical protein BJ878DRAFT_543985 [Calycina marina]